MRNLAGGSGAGAPSHEKAGMKTPVPTFAIEAADHSFEIRNYNWAKPFSSFLPGIAGPWGVPAWTFWVNRGQAIAGLGAADRDGQVLEFMSFNKACGRVMTEGFRTFLRIDGTSTYEPFRRTVEPDVEQILRVTPAEFTIEERNDRLGVEVTVTYHTLPGQRAAGLVRTVAVHDTSGRDRRLEWLDGAPRVLPFGIDQHGIKVIPRHIEAMIGIDHHAGAMLFRLKQSAADSARIESVPGANFYLSSALSGATHQAVDPTAVFGDQFAFDRPLVFDHGGFAAVQGSLQMWQGRTPCAFTALDDRLAAYGRCELISVLGTVEREADIEPLSLLVRSDWASLRDENRLLIDAIADLGATVSSTGEFDAYCRQNFLDNVIRGGMPVTLDSASGPTAVYAYSHQNGDLERDYHQFTLTPTYLSEGLGHYRNTAQNRRNDIWFFPDSGDINLKLFFGLIQLDGYNPLEILPQTYRVLHPEMAADWTRRWVSESQAQDTITTLMGGPFSIGRLAMWLEDATGSLPPQAALADAFVFLAAEEVGSTHAGFWIDHWHYALDLLESYLSVFPDRLSQILVDGGYTWFDNPDTVRPRSRRIVWREGECRQLDAVGRDADKVAMIAARVTDPYRARSDSGEVFRSTLLVKLLLLATTRLATLDPSGLGIEMEAGKPGWNDSLNGLPGLFGSGLSETIELRRLVRLVLEWIGTLQLGTVEVFDELADLIEVLTPLATDRAAGNLTATEFWNLANDAKERYRATVRLGVSGLRRSLAAQDLVVFCEAALLVLDNIFLGSGRDDVVSAAGIPHTYFVHRPQGAVAATGEVLPDAFVGSPTEPFLEGAVHWLREFPQDALAIYEAVRASSLYDAELQMYKTNGPMGDADPELGRAVGAYPPGWLENESVYTHMEYKYLLEVLRSGLEAEFWEDAVRALPPFLDPAVYGRSPLEGSSFIVSSAYPDPGEHGRGYQPRLSGMTAEFISIWLLATVGPRPFRLTEGMLEFAPKPLLPGWLFTDEPRTAKAFDLIAGFSHVDLPAGSFGFRFMGRGLCVYLNPGRRDTYGPDGARPAAFEIEFRNGRTATVESPVLEGGDAVALRAGEVRRLRILLR
ncbi:MAG: hypothetical protein IH941_01235 [Acidobacteria bacterium]|nr:hypothetical protein [Acidobacteriota bacterium]